MQRFASDVDAGLDLLVRVLLPYAAALLAGAGGGRFCSAAILPAGAVALAATLAVMCFVVPAAQQALARRAQARVPRCGPS